MKGILWVAALTGVAALVLFVLMILGVLPANSVKLVEGYMPMQMLFELVFFVGVFAVISYLLNKSGVPLPRFWQGIAFWAFILLYLLREEDTLWAVDH